MKKLILTSMIVFAVLPVSAKKKEKQLRACTETGMGVMCGEASRLVRCEGYSYNYYMDNQEKGYDMSFEIITKGYKFPGPYESKKNVFTIPVSKGSIAEYRNVASQHGTAMLNGTFKMPDFTNPENQRNQKAIEDLAKAIEQLRKSDGFKLNPQDSNEVSLDTFKIDSKSDLYQKCEKAKGVAPLTSELSPEQKKVIPEGNVQ